jgi:hypothetical protein
MGILLALGRNRRQIIDVIEKTGNFQLLGHVLLLTPAEGCVFPDLSTLACLQLISKKGSRFLTGIVILFRNRV